MSAPQPAGTVAGVDYERYWRERDLARSAARSGWRARLALRLLGARRGRLLEVGCGPGWALEVFRDAGGFEVRGLELSEAAVAQARARGLEVQRGDLNAPALGGESFDVIAALEALEHVADPLAALRGLVGHLRAGGCLVVSLPNEWHLLRRWRILWGRPDLGGHEDPHLRHFGVATARRFFAAAALRPLASLWDGLAPPRWRWLKSASEPLAQLAPGLFAISGVHLLVPESGGNPPPRSP